MSEPTATQAKAHMWISNAVFARLTGIKKVCMVCGQASNNADKTCPGERPVRATSLAAKPYRGLSLTEAAQFVHDIDHMSEEDD